MSSTVLPRRRRWPTVLLWLILLSVVGGTVWWWLRPSERFDVSIKFVEIQEQGGKRNAVFNVENRTNRDIHGIPVNPSYFSYQLLSPANERTYPGKLGGGWHSIPPGKTSKLVAPLVCPDGTPITGPFRVGLSLTDFRGQERMQSVCKLPGWAAHWVMKAMPKSSITDKAELHWSDIVTP